MRPEIAKTIAQLESLGAKFYLDGDRVKYRPVNDPRIEPVVQKLRPYKAEVARVLRERHSAPCGSARCAGCYEVAPGKRIHPPKSGQDWLAWLARWEPKEGTPAQ